MSDIIDEIKEDIKQERFSELWKEYGNYLIGTIIAVVLSTAGAVWWKSSTLNKNEGYGSDIYEVYLTEEADGAEFSIKAYSKLIEKDGVGNVYIAAMRKASLLVEVGEVEQANEIYKDVFVNKSVPDEVRDLAEILYLQNSIGKKQADDIKRLKEISKSDGVFKYSAKEILAFVEFDSGNYAGSKSLFEELKIDIYTPMKMRDRSVEMIKTIEAKTDA